MTTHQPSVAAIGTLVADMYRLPEESIPAELRELAPPDTLCQADPAEMPGLPLGFWREQIANGAARAGGQNNLTPQVALAGLRSYGVGVLGSSGLTRPHLDPLGEFIRDDMRAHGVLPAVERHAYLQSGTTVIVPGPEGKRPGIVYCPYANLETNLEQVFLELSRSKPDVIHWMYLGLMGEADRKLPSFFYACRNSFDPLVSLDVHTLIPNPERNVLSAGAINPLKLLPWVLPHVDVFFCSDAEVGLIAGLLALPNCPKEMAAGPAAKEEFIARFLDDIYRYSYPKPWSPVFGVTDRHGAYFKTDGEAPTYVRSMYDVEFPSEPYRVGLGDAFRSGVLMHYAANAAEFKAGTVDHREALQLGHLVATLSMAGRPENRWENIKGFDTMCRVARSGTDYAGKPIGILVDALKHA